MILHDKVFYFVDTSCKEDISKMDKDINGARREFRKHNVLSLRNAIEYCQEVFEDNKDKLKQTEVSGLTKVFTQLAELKESLLHNLVLVAGNQSVTYICTSTHKAIFSCRNPLRPVEEIMLSQKSTFIEFTDGGPGVGVPNRDVRYRFIEHARIINADYLIRVHLSNYDSSQMKLNVFKIM